MFLVGDWVSQLGLSLGNHKGMNLKLVAKKICEKSESINTPSETQQKKR